MRRPLIGLLVLVTLPVVGLVIWYVVIPFIGEAVV